MDIKIQSNEQQKFLTFSCDEVNLAANVKHVSEIIVSNTSVTKVPCVPDYVHGIMNLRGKIIPVINTRLLLGRNCDEHSEQSCIIVIQCDDEFTGLLVDYVKQINDISDQNLSVMPKNQSENKYLCGILKIGEEVNFILDCSLIGV